MNKNNVCFIFDKNFLCQGMTAIQSLIINNAKMQIDVYALVMNMDESLQRRVRNLSQGDIRVIVSDVTKYQERFQAIDSMGWSYATYIRLLLGEILPQSVETVLYIDSDTIVTGNLGCIFQVRLSDRLGAAVLDKYINSRTKRKTGLVRHDPYFNAGVLLVNLKQWRKEDTGRKCIQYLIENPGANDMPDQNALNAVLKGRIRLLPLSCNVDGYHAMLAYEQGKKIIRQSVEPFYDDGDYEEARRHPVIVHFTGWYLDKPWMKGNLQPYAQEFERYAAAAGARIIWKRRPMYRGLFTGRIRTRTRREIARAVQANDQQKIVKAYLESDRIMSAGSFIKCIFRRKV